MTKSIITVFALSICFAFTIEKNVGLDATYGVSDNDASKIELKLANNFEFIYQDYSNPNRKIEVQGTYTLKNDKIVLTSNKDQINFHNKWVLTDNRTAVKSRKGICFYTLREKN